jgi:hypothetical protein
LNDLHDTLFDRTFQFGCHPLTSSTMAAEETSEVSLSHLDARCSP